MPIIGVPGVSNPRTGFSSAGVPGMFDHQLAAGHYFSERLPMRIVHPRPDTEITEHARHSYWHPAFKYEIPVTVEGGAVGYKYVLFASPSGATISQTGLISWTPTIAHSGTYLWSVGVVDQEGRLRTTSWACDEVPEKFVFVKASVETSGSGTFASPLKTWADWYLNSDLDATFANRIVVFLGGDYTLVGDSVTTNALLRPNVKCRAIIADPDTVSRVNCGTGKINAIERIDDLFFSHVRYHNGDDEVNNAHFFQISGDSERITFFKGDYSDIGAGTVGTDNVGPIFIANTGRTGQNVSVTHNHFHDFSNNSGFNGTMVTVYRFDHVVCAHNTAANVNTGTGWNMKGCVNYVTVRDNVATENMVGKIIGIGYWNPVEKLPNYQEVCYNRIVVQGADSMPLICVDNFMTPAQPTGLAWVYRNTFVGGSTWIRFPGTINLFFCDANIVVTNNTSRWGASAMLVTVANVVQTSAADLVDPVTGLLAGAGLAHLGTKGEQRA